ncbi:uncharacterized protein LAESUDRAFT_723899 [Laetiporus sulphureus 93-53]|uniref:Uncharacterized protein n=1 Tax=Laetiporus sulphureus 93-53 TaxID=1314785 RepID=A0A165F4V9_9APHY|nr:uncharacterized protein LAESUDRAFT_723899 [Laetiporus sulphureus 93-53]KZT08391.1 hypothetical protein LAESUDRAFT_723899 [Laetiporus sulphureus 93-53]
MKLVSVYENEGKRLFSGHRSAALALVFIMPWYGGCSVRIDRGKSRWPTISGG